MKFNDPAKNRSAGHIQLTGMVVRDYYQLSEFFKAGLEFSVDFYLNFCEMNLDKEKGNIHDLPLDKNPYYNCLTRLSKYVQNFTKDKKVQKIENKYKNCLLSKLTAIFGD